MNKVRTQTKEMLSKINTSNAPSGSRESIDCVPMTENASDQRGARKISYERGDERDPHATWSKGKNHRKDGNS